MKLQFFLNLFVIISIKRNSIKQNEQKYENRKLTNKKTTKTNKKTK